MRASVCRSSASRQCAVIRAACIDGIAREQFLDRGKRRFRAGAALRSSRALSELRVVVVAVAGGFVDASGNQHDQARRRDEVTFDRQTRPPGELADAQFFHVSYSLVVEPDNPTTSSVRPPQGGRVKPESRKRLSRELRQAEVKRRRKLGPIRPEGRVVSQYAIVIEGVGSANYSAYAPDLAGVAATGDTIEECEDATCGRRSSSISRACELSRRVARTTGHKPRRSHHRC